jgi:putative phage-type endonuclease
MMLIELEQGSEEWKQFRKSKVGASDAPIIMGDSPWTTIRQLYDQKLDLVPERECTHAMEEGHRIEPLVRQFALALTGLEMKPCVVQSVTPWMIASLDGLSACGKLFIEIKLGNAQDHAVAKAGKIPKKYFAQLQHQMYVMEHERCLYISYHKDTDDYQTVWVDRDNAYIKQLLEEEEKFNTCLITRTPPELTDRDYRSREDLQWQDLTSQWMREKEQMDLWIAREKETKEKLITLAGGLNTRGAGVRISKVTRQGTISYGSIPQLQGVDLNAYRNPGTEYFRVSIDSDH